ncbi:FAD-binding oxidoreductase [Paenibacillus sp. FSL W7-1088]|uniref:FAD-binding oxidoreductase n=1 Tax=unclassified Paenibacillus TaxID=185978 RepID=UPI0015C5FC07|nr:FAD-binding oxidoreductase [Paenibacillus sp. E222]QLG40455.1 FAD-binding oxidoreductase [Paenibacillus sp. E222]
MNEHWIAVLKERMDPELLQWEEAALAKYSMDYHHFSPVLASQLQGKIAECIASPHTEEELDDLLSIAAELGVPLTIRGNGTGNYGQCVPVTGGIVLNLAKYNKVLEMGEGTMRIQAGARLGKMESTARKAGYELRTMPSTFQSATIGGFLCGGFGGIGSISWGTIWDGLVRSLKIKTVEVHPRTIELQGDEVLPYLHTYGTIGILSEVEINLAPRVEWMQWAVTFDRFEQAFRFGQAVAEDTSLMKRLISIHEWPVPSYFLPLDLPADHAVALLEVDTANESQLECILSEYGGHLAMKVSAEQYHKGVGVSDFTWNHTTLWARKADPGLTYLQLNFDPSSALEQISLMKKEYPEVMNHIEFARQNGNLLISGLPLVPFTTEENLNQLMECYEKNRVIVNNPHTWDLKEGGRSYAHDRLWEIKHHNDPKGILNQEKLKRSAVSGI